MDPISTIKNSTSINQLVTILGVFSFFRNAGNISTVDQDIEFNEMVDTVKNSLNLQEAQNLAIDFFST